MSIGASLILNNFWRIFFFTNIFRGLKDTIQLYIKAENEKILRTVFEKIQKYSILPLFPDFKKFEIFLKNYV